MVDNDDLISNLKFELELSRESNIRFKKDLDKTAAELAFFKSFLQNMNVCPHCGKPNDAFDADRLHKVFMETYRMGFDSAMYDGRVIIMDDPDPELELTDEELHKIALELTGRTEE